MPYIDRDEIPFTFVHGRFDDVYVSQEKIMQIPTADVVDKALYKRLLENSVIIAAALHTYQSADMVEVVRCKDCKHRPTGTGADHDLEFPDDKCPCQCAGDYWYSWMPPDDWFCPCGEKKETEDEG